MTARAVLVAGLGFGDEGKGSTVDWLVRAQRADTVVRYNGGAQAAHHVVTADGREHCFAQFSAGTFVPGVRTFLSRFVVVDLLALAAEEQVLCARGVTDGYRRLTIDPRCVIATPFHRIVNHMRELCRGPARHGSCGMGIGEARLDSERAGLPVVTVADTRDRARLRQRLRLLWLVKLDQAEQLLDSAGQPAGQPADQTAESTEALTAALADLRRPDRVEALTEHYADLVAGSGLRVAPEPARAAPDGVAIFEGAQGVLLDRNLGFWPHVTPSQTTFAHADTLLGEWGVAPSAIVRVGVMRAYATRHGAGPLVTEDGELSDLRPDRHNGTHRWQGPFRLGWFDAVAARYAARVIGPLDQLVVTNLDRLAGLPEVRMCHEYRAPDGHTVADIPLTVPMTDDREKSRARTRWLSECRPCYRRYPGWSSDWSASDPARPTWPDELLAFVRDLQSPAGIGRSIDTLSLGPTAADKHRLVVGPLPTGSE